MTDEDINMATDIDGDNSIDCTSLYAIRRGDTGHLLKTTDITGDDCGRILYYFGDSAARVMTEHVQQWLFRDTGKIVPIDVVKFELRDMTSIHNIKITGTLVLGDEVDPDYYPHECPHCEAPAYIGGDNTVDCSRCEGRA